MPTPVAVLTAAQLLSQGYMEEKGWGELVVVDIAGATTDIHSIARGNPAKGQTSDCYRSQTLDKCATGSRGGTSVYSAYPKMG
jgi:hypothetical protein